MRSWLALAAVLASCGSERTPVQAEPHARAPAMARPADAAPPDVGIDAPMCRDTFDCQLTADRGACIVGRWVGRVEGALCACEDHACVRYDVPPIACRRDEECGTQDLHGFTVPAKLARPRKRPLRPCTSDGETIPKCMEHVCKIVTFPC